MPYTDPEEFIDIDEASLLNDSLDYQMDLSAPHPALWDDYKTIITYRHFAVQSEAHIFYSAQTQKSASSSPRAIALEIALALSGLP